MPLERSGDEPDSLCFLVFCLLFTFECSSSREKRLAVHCIQFDLTFPKQLLVLIFRNISENIYTNIRVCMSFVNVQGLY